MIITNLVYNKELACFDNLINNIAVNEGREYRLFYSGAWNIYFDDKEKTLGKKIHINYYNDFDLLKIIHGIQAIKVSELNKTDYLKYKLLQYRYIIVFVDAYFLDYHVDYKKKHGNGYSVLVDGLTAKNNSVLITDPKYKKHCYSIDFSQYKKAAFDGCGYCFRLSESILIPSIRFLLKLLIKKALSLYNYGENYKKLYVGFTNLQVEKEYGDSINAWDTLVIEQISKLIVDRYRYIQFLNCFYEYYNLDFRIISDLLEQSAVNWQILRNNLIRQISLQTVNQCSNIERIKRIIDLEKNACSTMFKKAIADLNKL